MRNQHIAKVEYVVLQAVASILLSVFLLPSSPLRQECSETKIQGGEN